jgi:hypothetical protein
MERMGWAGTREWLRGFSKTGNEGYRRFGARRMEFLGILTLLASVGCRGDGGPAEPQPGEAIPVVGPYLGQTPPGLVPQRFGPPAILATRSWGWHSPPGFSPDGMQMYWTKIKPSGGMFLAFTEGGAGGWSAPQPPSFARGDGENQPQFSSDGGTIYYVSANNAGHLFRVTRSGSGWSQPQPLGLPLSSGMAMGWQFCVVEGRAVYVDAEFPRGGAMDIFRAPRTSTGYGPPVAVSVNTRHNEFAPYVAPDESYMIFVSNRPGGRGMHDLWITFRKTDGTWSEPLNMGPTINSSGEDGMPTVTHDGLYLFYTATRSGDAGYNPYWVSTQVIQNLRSQAGL